MFGRLQRSFRTVWRKNVRNFQTLNGFSFNDNKVRSFALTATIGTSVAHSTIASNSTGSGNASCHAADSMDGTCNSESGDADTKEVFRLDYKSSPYLIPEIYMDFNLGESKTILKTTSIIKHNTGSDSSSGISMLPMKDLELDGESCIQLKKIFINGNELINNDNEKSDSDRIDYIIDKKNEKLIIKSHMIPPTDFKLDIIVELKPNENTALAGLYSTKSHLLCTQCEALGFRRITYHLDRPDILSKYKVRLQGKKKLYPQLLSNGNLIEKGDIFVHNGSNGDDEHEQEHYAIWEDPFNKPSYLFALVAGDLKSIHDTYITTSGKVVNLGIYSDPDDYDKLDHSMYSLKKAMKWDEDTYGLECDLNTYNVVATADFNMGAMENKGLNVFNSAYVLAKPSTATDTDYENILGVIGHEYFHNWTGNRITLRDWFQLTLKEGLTVFRDQSFSSDMTGVAVKRINDVKTLRMRQFAEDSSPMSHPIRPESYISMDNFYTSTVYNKGAEVVSMA